MSGEEQEQILTDLVKERDKLGYEIRYDSLMSYPLFIAFFIIMLAIVGISSMQLHPLVELQFSYGLMALYFGCGGAAIGLWGYGTYNKALIGGGKTIVKAHMFFMEPNSTNVKGAYEHTLVVENTPKVSAAEPVKELVDILPELKDEAFAKIMENIEARLPKLPDGKKYKVVRFLIPDSPFPDLILMDGRYKKGGRGTYVNKSLLMVVHEDFCEPTEMFDFSPDETPTYYGRLESGQPCHLGSICLWEFYELTQEWVCTPGILPEQRHTMQQVRPSDKEREYTYLVELLRLIPKAAGSDIRAKSTLESLQEYVLTMQKGQAANTGMNSLTPGFRKSNFFEDIWNKYRFWIILGIVFLAIASVWIFLGGGG